MGASVSNSRLPDSRSFNLIKDSMLQSDELPLAEVLDENQWEAIFGKHQIDFGNDEQAVYTPAITLWALLSQASVFQTRDAELQSCRWARGKPLGNAWQNSLQHQHRSLLPCQSQNLLASDTRYLLSNRRNNRSHVRCAKRGP